MNAVRSVDTRKAYTRLKIMGQCTGKERESIMENEEAVMKWKCGIFDRQQLKAGCTDLKGTVKRA
jgi:hypothetical protein